MAVKIRMKRLGRRNRPFYRLVAIDSRKRRDGKAIEELGWYNPILQTEKNYELKTDRILYWLEKGAQPSNTVRNLLKCEGLLYRVHLKNQGLDDKAIDYEIQKWALDRDERIKLKLEKTNKKKAEQAKKKNEASLASSTESEDASDESKDASVKEETDSDESEVKSEEGSSEEVSTESEDASDESKEETSSKS